MQHEGAFSVCGIPTNLKQILDIVVCPSYPKIASVLNLTNFNKQ